MIREFEFFHGAALVNLIHDKKIYSIVTYPSVYNASYVINDGIGIYGFRCSDNKRRSPAGSTGS